MVELINKIINYFGVNLYLNGYILLITILAFSDERYIRRSLIKYKPTPQGKPRQSKQILSSDKATAIQPHIINLCVIRADSLNCRKRTLYVKETTCVNFPKSIVKLWPDNWEKECGVWCPLYHLIINLCAVMLLGNFVWMNHKLKPAINTTRSKILKVHISFQIKSA